MLAAVFLAGCGGATGAATSWPGLTIDEDSQTAYLAYGQHVYAINLENGTERWRFPAEADNKISFYASPTLSEDGQLLLGGYDNKLYSVNAENGQQNWVFTQSTDRYVASPLAANGSIYAPSANHRLYALNTSGQLDWTFTSSRPLWATPTAGEDRIFLSAMDHYLYALDPANGEVLWKSEDLGGAVVGMPVVQNGMIYVGSFGPGMAAVEAETGKVVWRYPTAGWVWSGPAVDGETLYFGDLAGTMYALNASTGEEIWKTAAEEGKAAAIAGRPLVRDGSVYFGGENGILYVLDAATGNTRKQELGGKLYAGPQAAGNLMLIPSVETDALLIALDENNNQAWAFQPQN